MAEEQEDVELLRLQAMAKAKADRERGFPVKKGELVPSGLEKAFMGLDYATTGPLRGGLATALGKQDIEALKKQLKFEQPFPSGETVTGDPYSGFALEAFTPGRIAKVPLQLSSVLGAGTRALGKVLQRDRKVPEVIRMGEGLVTPKSPSKDGWRTKDDISTAYGKETKRTGKPDVYEPTMGQPYRVRPEINPSIAMGEEAVEIPYAGSTIFQGPPVEPRISSIPEGKQVATKRQTLSQEGPYRYSEPSGEAIQMGPISRETGMAIREPEVFSSQVATRSGTLPAKSAAVERLAIGEEIPVDDIGPSEFGYSVLSQGKEKPGILSKFGQFLEKAPERISRPITIPMAAGGQRMIERNAVPFSRVSIKKGKDEDLLRVFDKYKIAGNREAQAEKILAAKEKIYGSFDSPGINDSILNHADSVFNMERPPLKLASKPKYLAPGVPKELNDALNPYLTALEKAGVPPDEIASSMFDMTRGFADVAKKQGGKIPPSQLNAFKQTIYARMSSTTYNKAGTDTIVDKMKKAAASALDDVNAKQLDRLGMKQESKVFRQHNKDWGVLEEITPKAEDLALTEKNIPLLDKFQLAAIPAALGYGFGTGQYGPAIAVAASSAALSGLRSPRFLTQGGRALRSAGENKAARLLDMGAIRGGINLGLPDRENKK